MNAPSQMTEACWSELCGECFCCGIFPLVTEQSTPVTIASHTELSKPKLSLFVCPTFLLLVVVESECYQSVQQMFILVPMTSSVELYFGRLMFKKRWGEGWNLVMSLFVCALTKGDAARGLWCCVRETHSWREGRKQELKRR